MASVFEKPTYGTFKYIPRNSPLPPMSPYIYHLPATSFFTFYYLPMKNIRSTLFPYCPFTLSKEGFTARISPSALSFPPYTHSSWTNESLLKSIYVPEVETLARSVIPAKTIFVYQVILRTTAFSEVDSLANHDAQPPSLARHEKEEPDFPIIVGTKKGSEVSPVPQSPLGLDTCWSSYSTPKIPSRDIKTRKSRDRSRGPLVGIGNIVRGSAESIRGSSVGRFLHLAAPQNRPS